MRLVPLSLLLLCGCAPLDDAVNLDRVVQVFQPPARVEVWVDAGHVTVQVGPTTQVERRLRWQGDVPPTSGVRRVGGTLVVDGTCPARAVGCAVDVDLVLPADAVLEVFTGAGDVAVSGLSDDVFADTGAGFVDLDALAGRVDVHTARGDVQGTGLGGATIQARADDGAVDLVLDAPPETEDLSGAGDVTLGVPAGAYALDLSAPAGRVLLSAVQADDAAPNEIVAVSGSGDVRITGSE